MTERSGVVVVGAGHAGLCVAAALRKRGVGCTMIDDAERPGDVWRSRYDGLRLNTERDASAIPGVALPDDVGRWPTRDEWADHIEAAARELAADRIVEHVESVESAESSEGETDSDRPRWVVVTDRSRHHADTVVVATGRNRLPEIPPWPGREESPIVVIHAASYRRPDDFSGRRVLVVGAGNSGTEIAHLLRDAGVDVMLSMRTRPVWAQRELFGTNLTDFARLGRRLPTWMVDLSGRVMQPLLFGRMKPSGLGPPQRRLSRVAEASGATVDSGFVDDVKAGRIETVAALDWIDGRSVVLVDGRRVDPDVVVAATGYTPALGDLLPADLVDDGWPIVGTPPFEQAPGLFTAGLNPATLTAFHPDFIAEGDLIADRISGTM